MIATSKYAKFNPLVMVGITGLLIIGGIFVVFTRAAAPPVLAIVAPTQNAVLSGKVVLNARIDNFISGRKDPTKAKVEYYANTKLLGRATANTYGWMYNWDTATTPDGPYAVTVKAYETDGKAYTSPAVMVTLKNTTVVPADPLATQDARNLLNLLVSLPTRSNNRIMSGQFVGNSSSYNSNVDPIVAATGKTPRLIGFDFIWNYTTPPHPPTPRLVNWKDIANFAGQRATAGQIITVSFHLDNPVTNNQYNDLTGVSQAMLTPGTAANNNLNASLDYEVQTFAQLQSYNIPVLFRPFHEMNGNWFWWGSLSWYKQLWQYNFNYLTSHGVHNVIYAYAPNSSADMSYYPGNDYVDVVGVDTYDANPLNGQWITAQQTYAQASAAPGKPFGVTEYGFANPAPPPNTYDNLSLLNALKMTQDRAPGASFFMSWGDQWSIAKQKNLSTLYNDPALSNLGDL